VPGLAVSIVYGKDPHYETAAAIAAAAIDWVAGTHVVDGPAPVLNLNVPNISLDQLAGIREAQLAAYGEAWVASASGTGDDLKLEFQGQRRDPEPGTDRALLHEKFATITALTGIESVSAGTAAEATTAALRLREREG
jgi:5'-nucleotidase